MVVMLDEDVHLRPYDPRWPQWFAAEAPRLADTLPPRTAIEHIGSTSVPGMLAKPVIDLMVSGPVVLVRNGLLSAGCEDLGEAGVPGLPA
jgi:GrpB-like predicted nucleotidyltransferase (UPF0157 family)